METAEPAGNPPVFPGGEAAAIVPAKLRVPEPFSPLLARPRIAKRLHGAVEQSMVVLLIGPSGIGKTSELVQLSAVTARPLAWVTVDGRDNDPQRFWSHVVRALRMATGDPDLEPPATVGPGSDLYVAALADRLLAGELRPVLVLDEYEHVVSADIHGQLDALIRSSRDRLTTVIASRARPPLRLEHLMLSGRLTAFGWPDLRFDPHEGQRLLAEAFGVAVEPTAMAAVTSAVDGWAAGLMLVGVHLRGGQDAAALATRLAIGRDEARDYLIDHVWAHIPQPVREFLLDTAVLGRFCAALADAVRRRADSADLLDQIRRDALFLTAEDGSGVWLSYQRLFRHALVQRLEAMDPDRVRALRRSAAEWHVVHGSHEEAVGYALLARDYVLAAKLVRELFDTYLLTGRVATLERWLSSFPDEEIAKVPWLVDRALNLWCLVGRFDERDRWSRIGVGHRDEQPIRPEDGWRLCLPRERGDLALALRQGRALLRGERSPAEQPLTAIQTRLSVARTLLLAGNLAECRNLLAGIGDIATEVPPPIRVAMHGIAGLAAHLGRDRAAAVGHAAGVRDALRECQTRPVPRTAPEALILRAVLTEGKDAGEGLARLAELTGASPGLGTDRTMRAFALLLLARALAAHANADEAARCLTEADHLLARCPSPLGLIDLRDEVAQSIPGFCHNPRPAAAPLSEREAVVLRYLRSELTLREIAEDLYVSVNTVKTHVRNLYRKLGVSGRSELHDRAARLLPDPEVG